MGGGKGRDWRSTQVSESAPPLEPKARLHAGSRDWKYSSGWKKVRRVTALRILSEINDRKMVEWMENTASWRAGRERERAGGEGGDMVTAR